MLPQSFSALPPCHIKYSAHISLFPPTQQGEPSYESWGKTLKKERTTLPGLQQLCNQPVQQRASGTGRPRLGALWCLLQVWAHTMKFSARIWPLILGKSFPLSESLRVTQRRDTCTRSPWGYVNTVGTPKGPLPTSLWPHPGSWQPVARYLLSAYCVLGAREAGMSKTDGTPALAALKISEKTINKWL